MGRRDVTKTIEGYPLAFRGELIPEYSGGFRISSQKDLVGYVLMKYRSSTNPIKNWELNHELLCSRFQHQIYELRNEGWKIETKRGKDAGSYSYRLLSHPTDNWEDAQQSFALQQSYE